MHSALESGGGGTTTIIDIQIRTVKKAKQSTGGDGQADNGEAGTAGQAGTATPPSIPTNSRDVAPPPGGQPQQTTPAGFNFQIPLGENAGSAGYNIGSLFLEGPISPSLPNLINLDFRDPKMAGVVVTKFSLGNPPVEYPRQIHIFDPLLYGTNDHDAIDWLNQLRGASNLGELVDIQAYDANGGVIVRFYKFGDFDSVQNVSSSQGTPGAPGSPGYIGYHPIHAGAVPTRSFVYQSIQAAGDHLGGLRVTATGTDQIAHATAYVNLSAGGWRVTNLDNGVELETKDYSSFFTYVSGYWQRIDNAEVKRSGCLISRNCSTYAFRSRREGAGAPVVQSALFKIQEMVFDSEGTSRTTTWEPDPMNIGRPKSVIRPDGSWAAYTYYTSASGPWNGKLKETLKPWNGQPAQPSLATSLNSESTVVSYDLPSAAPGNSLALQLARKVTTRPKSGGGIATVSDWSKTTGSGLANMIYFLGQAGLDPGWAPTSSQINDESSAEAATAAESIVASSYSYANLSDPNMPWSGGPFGTLDADGIGTATGYERGTFSASGGTFLANDRAGDQSVWGTDIRAVTINLAGFGEPAVGEATREIVIRNKNGVPYLKEFAINQVTGWKTATTTTYEYPTLWPDGSPKEVIVKQDGRIISRSAAGTSGTGTTLAVWDEQGIETDTVYDALGRPTSVTKIGIGTQPNIVTTYGYVDPSGFTPTTTMVVSAGGFSRTRTTVGDLSGRTISETEPSGAVTTTSYPNGGRDTRTILPGGLERLITRNIDGRTVSITGTGVVPEYYSHETLTSGNLELAKCLGTSGSARYVKTEQDWAGRPKTITTPDPAGGADVSTATGYASGTRRMTSRTSPAGALLFKRPSAISSETYSGYDVNGVNGLEVNGIDRVTDTRTSYEFDGQYWWKISTRSVAESSSSWLYSSSKRCLHGQPNGFAAKSVTVSPTQPETTVSTLIDRTTKTLTRRESVSGMADVTDVNVNGLLTSQTARDSNNATRWDYDALGQPLREISPRGAITRKTYHADGSLATTVDHANKMTSYSYYGPAHMSAGKLSLVTNPSINNAPGTTTSYVYSELGKVTEVAGTAAYKVTYNYDAYGAMEGMHTWRDATTSDGTVWVYQPGTGLLTQKQDAASQHVDYTYWSSGQLHTRTWARGVSTTYSYDNAWSDLTGITYSGTVTPNVTFSNFNAMGRPGSVTQAGVGTEILTYQNGFPDARYYASGHSLLPGLGVRTSPDAMGRRGGFVETSNLNTNNVRLVYYFYDSSDRLATISDGNFDPDSAYSHIYTYHPNSSLVATINSRTSGSSWFRESRYYDTQARLLGIRSDRMAGTSLTAEISAHAYDYDGLNRRTKNTFQDGSTAVYGYNDRSEVLSSTRKNAAGTAIPQLDTSYTYDGIGNRLTSNSPVMGNHTYTPNGLNQYASITTGNSRAAVGRAPVDPYKVHVAGVEASRIGEIYWRDLTATNTAVPVWQSVITKRDTGTPTTTTNFWYAKTPTVPTYDLDGNLTSDGRWTYSWDAENRLIQMVTTTEATTAGHPYTKLTFAYDWQGKRIARTVFKGGPTTITSNRRWLYDGWNVIAEFSETTETGGTPQRLNTFTWGLDLSGTLQGAGGVGGLLVQTTVSSGVIERASYDGNGNIVAWTKSTATAPTSRREYDAFGNTLVSEGTAPSTFGFSTKMQDGETGLYYYGYRYYDAPNGRWLNKDPIEEKGGVNLYEFIENRTLDRLDVLGKNISIPGLPDGSEKPDRGVAVNEKLECSEKDERETKVLHPSRIENNNPLSNFFHQVDKLISETEVEALNTAITATWDKPCGEDEVIGMAVVNAPTAGSTSHYGKTGLTIESSSLISPTTTYSKTTAKFCCKCKKH